MRWKDYMRDTSSWVVAKESKPERDVSLIAALRTALSSEISAGVTQDAERKGGKC